MKKITINNLSYKYSLAENKALNNISLEVEKGDFIGVVGPNKAGKSTLCKSLVGLIPHFYKGEFEGEILIDNLNTLNSSIAELSLKVGLVFQNPFNQISGAKLSVYDELAFGLENNGLGREEMITRIDKYLNLMDLNEVKDNNPFELSGGQMQKLAIASIMALKPDVFVLDEPTSQLDPQGTEEVFKAVSRLREENLTVILVSQKLNKLADYANKILFLNQGEIAAYDNTAAVFSRNDLEQMGMGAPIYTEIARELGLKNEKNQYPIRKSELKEMLVAKYGKNIG
ncbi:energy-coupling factor transport system ATP-binding protein [Halanaerobium saccharolyticum]|uniref:Energy-coupling factor transport system ATP-binding protein n=1 Tax=Halanaerobium saccharolyticum TaxID=43595 RepID=A0A4R7YRZ5_9FIRM|nr:ABC transporter ATP-binding protein [Halanaerobium saccharolyticum]RAK10269.1 energy-coupling factor transport system ATP-binding protein [Halanaerobium saccharolyticum]TDW00481.1 energy-coupling factor transport system ATP-binding protein [Halanaerobium saccharolyticum]TDX52066.1 energy-coupling factor transport system ATP-binding protein [Halanaerobium saccharolyticum]